MKISITIVIISFFVLLSVCLQAQQRPPQPPPTDTLVAREVRSLHQQLTLSQEQTAQVKETLNIFHEKRQGLQVTAQPQDAAVRKQQVQAARKAHEDALKKILTPAQWAAYEKGVAERRAAFLQHAKEKKIPVKELEE